jgi:hypothetical protein
MLGTTYWAAKPELVQLVASGDPWTTKCFDHEALLVSRRS